MRQLTSHEAELLAPLLEPRLPQPYCGIHVAGLTVKQQAAHLLHDVFEILYGGAGGGGKTWWLLAEALAYVDVPGYAALLLRSTFPNLSREPDGLIPLSHTWLSGTDAIWHADTRTWKFPSGAVLTFGHLQRPRSHHDYAGPSYQYVGFDEVTEIRPGQYEFLQTRMRRLQDSEVPIRLRAASNPGGEYHHYYRHRFGLDGTPRPKGRMYVPAKVTDNPHMDIADYTTRLRTLSPVLRRRILDGDWSIDDTGGMFYIGHVPLVEDWPRHARQARAWDLAATDPVPGTDPDWTVGVKLAWDGATAYVVDIVRIQGSPEKVDKLFAATVSRDGRACDQLIEEEKGGSGPIAVNHFRRLAREDPNAGRVRAAKLTGDKTTRAFPFASAFNDGHVAVVLADWNDSFLAQCSAFPNVRHDDMVDGGAHAYNFLVPQSTGSSVRAPSRTRV